MKKTSRIEAMHTQPITNYLRSNPVLWKKYVDWMCVAYGGEHGGGRGVDHAKRVLRRQDYCWTGSHRYYIWEWAFEVPVEGEFSVTWHWRLFASVRGLSLEIEHKPPPAGVSMEDVCRIGLDSFIKRWEKKR